MAEVIRKHKQRLGAVVEALTKENDTLRGLLANGKGDCIYCHLPATDISKCPRGFPGCSRMDDMLAAPESKAVEDCRALRYALMQIKLIAGKNKAVHESIDQALIDIQ